MAHPSNSPVSSLSGIVGLNAPYSLPADRVLEALASSRQGLSLAEVAARQATFDLNRLPEQKRPGAAIIFLRQFLNPLIYILLAAAIASLLVGKFTDAGFIFVVLIVNALIGTIQEYSAQQSASALQKIVTRIARVIRSGEAYEVDAELLVPGDVVSLESGDKVPADIRLFDTHGLEIDESLLSGESLPVLKNEHHPVLPEAAIADHLTMAYGGSLITRGRGRGVVVATGMATQLGRIAEQILGQSTVKPPLLLRMEKFTFRIAWLMGLMVILLGLISLSRGTSLTEVMLIGAALAVAAIPEGLPVAMTVALSISMRRMARRHVIVRKLVAVEALGSCTYIVSDKTGTLTVNELTVSQLVLPGGEKYTISGTGMIPEGKLQGMDEDNATLPAGIKRLAMAAVLVNEGFLGLRGDEWVHHGDAVDVALLVMAHKFHLTRPEMIAQYPELDRIPYEPANQFAAATHTVDGKTMLFVKGAHEKILPMCERMSAFDSDMPLDEKQLDIQAHQLAESGYRVIAFAAGESTTEINKQMPEQNLHGLVYLGVVGIMDPLRTEASAAISACHAAGIDVAMVTGDHPITARVIAQGLGLATNQDGVVTGQQIKQYQDQAELDQITRKTHLFARVEPRQKLDIVQSLQRNGHFVAVTGDGVNDAPALRAAHVGVAMGKSGTDIARETADIIITDDNFSSIVAGIEEGRIAYANVRKVIFLLLSTGAGEIVLFLISLLSGLPLPLTAVQLLWLNLVTNGIQDIALALEPGEGDELKRPPRAPNESIFNRSMIERVCLSALVIGTVSYLAFAWLLRHGYAVEEARNSVLLLMVLFENIHVFNSRSELKSAFILSPLRNPILLFGTLLAQALHIGAMYIPGLSAILAIQAVDFSHWLFLLSLATSLLITIELYKLFRGDSNRHIKNDVSAA